MKRRTALEVVAIGLAVVLVLVLHAVPIGDGADPAGNGESPPPPSGGSGGDSTDGSGEDPAPSVFIPRDWFTSETSGHAWMFFGLAVVTATATRGRPVRHRALLVLGVGFATGLVGESMQSFLSYRTASGQDLAVDWAITLGMAVMVLVWGTQGEVSPQGLE